MGSIQRLTITDKHHMSTLSEEAMEQYLKEDFLLPGEPY